MDDDDALWRLECGIRGEAPGRGRPRPPQSDRTDTQSNNSAPPLQASEIAALQQAYLHWVCGHANQVSLLGIDRKAAPQERETCLELGAIYTALLTLEAERDQKPGFSAEETSDVPLLTLEAERDQKPGFSEKPDFSAESDVSMRRVPALAQVNQHPRLVLLGDPGSGKSTFINFTAICLAGELLEDELAPNLQLLTAPLPNDKGEDQEERQPWDLGALLPVRVILRDFAARGLPLAGQAGRAAHMLLYAHKI